MVKDTSLYDTLGVTSDATSVEIRKAYYRLAREHHPDKGGDEVRFKAIVTAYETLIDDDRRQRYDEGGLSNNGQDEMDPRVLFRALFGGGKFAVFFGEPDFDMLMTQMANGGEQDQVAMQEAEEKRIRNLVDKLRELVDPFIHGRDAEFMKIVLGMCAELSAEVNGPSLLCFVGYVYTNQAKKAMGGLGGFFASVGEKGHMVKEIFGFGKGAVAMARADAKLQMAQNADNLSMEEQERMIIQQQEEMQMHGRNMFYKQMKFISEMTVRSVCDGLLNSPDLKDPSRRNERKRFCDAVKRLGDELTRYGKAEELKQAPEISTPVGGPHSQTPPARSNSPGASNTAVPAKSPRAASAPPPAEEPIAAAAAAATAPEPTMDGLD